MALIDRLLGRSSADDLVREHGPQVARLLRRLFGPRADIDDVFQAVFVEVLRGLPTFAGRAQLGTWIHRVALNVAYQEMRLRYRERARDGGDASLEDLVCDREDAERAVARAESVRRLYAALESIEPRQRIPLILHELEGRPLREVGELLGRPLQTVASQVKAGRAELARALREAEPEEDGEHAPAERDAMVRGPAESDPAVPATIDRGATERTRADRQGEGGEPTAHAPPARVRAAGAPDAGARRARGLAVRGGRVER